MKSNTSKVTKFDDFGLTLKFHLVDDLFIIGLPVQWESFKSDRFRAKTKDERTQISITTWNLKDDIQPPFDHELKEIVLPQYEDYVNKGGYEPHDDLIINEKYISKSFKVDDETQYYLMTMNNVNGETYLTNLIIRDIGKYDPQKRAALLSIVSTMKFEYDPQMLKTLLEIKCTMD